MKIEMMSIGELFKHIDLTARCRDHKFREEILYNLRKFYPDHKVTKAAESISKKTPKRDKEFRQRFRLYMASREGED